MALDREDTLKKAEKLLRQGKLDAAIAEYSRVVEDQPRDWTTANTLGDLYARAGQSDMAVAQYARIADAFMEDGFYPKASALLKKILKITPADEAVHLKLADLSVRQGLLADAKSQLNAVAARRRTRGDQRGVDEIVVRLGKLDPGDMDARAAAARVLAANGDSAEAGAMFRSIYEDLTDKGRGPEALEALREAVRIEPGDASARAILARAAVAAGDLDAARGYLDRKAAGSDPALLGALLEIELRSGRLDEARALVAELYALEPDGRTRVNELAAALASSAPDAAFVCVESSVDAAGAVGDFADAAVQLQAFIGRTPGHIPALLKLVEVCVDGGLESTMYEAQVQLTDAYLAAGQASEARVIAEDLVAREPWEQVHIERFRRALVMLRVQEPDSVIAERLSGQSPFTAHDHFAEPMSSAAPSSQATAEIAAAPAPETVEAAPPAEPATGEEVDLTSVLGELDAPTQAGHDASDDLEEVFKDFRSAVSRQSGTDQSAQHMKLAQTYLEMGMIDEAVFSLKTASRSPRHRFEAAALLGRVYQEQNDLPHAIEWLERAAEAPAPDVEEGRALLYDLGAALEASNERTRALGVFLELQAQAGEYRDLAARIDRLARVQTGG